MQKKLSFCLLLPLLLFLLTSWASALNITPINSLIENAKALDGKQVTVQGEAVGEGLARGEYCWVNIHDGTNAIGIWMTVAEAKRITCYGNYKYKGDTVTVTGVFRRACAEHGGESDIHCDKLEIAKPGHATDHHIALGKVTIAAVLLLALIILLFYIYRFKLRKKEHKAA